MSAEKIKYLIEHEAEGSLLDFKLEPYSLGTEKKSEFLKDLSAMANVLLDEDKYIILGVVEKDGLACGFRSIGNLPDESNFQKYINDNIEPDLQFEIKRVEYSGYDLAFIRIFGNKDRPYLFTKEIIDGQTSKVKFRPGDGFIRKGSATTKIVRAHLDRIYAAKWQRKDRKADIEVICSVKPSKELPQFDHIDVTIINKSNTSINFSVDLKIFKQDGLWIAPKFELQRELAKDLKEAMYYTPAIAISNLQRDNHFLVATGLKNGITLLQNDCLQDVLEENAMILMTSEKVVFKCELFVRSDDFTQGMLIQNIELSAQRR
ncbi:AlbA family DNA-binding domain-containing protein [Dyadobacter bucti]|uniref:AlbA family DNA-binding domain-containing protein n=1 Tax=Dyadobacter bucti TaxID=2572203 RepID=UPI00110875B8|nr:ATP-binding protein [Dyadobacter bucti]